mgnify:CR=1 FL=1
MLTLYLSESYAKKDLLLVRLRPSVANAIIGTELILLTLPPGTSSLRADPTFLLPSQADAEPHYLAALRSPRGGSGSDRRDKALSMVMKEGEMPGRQPLAQPGDSTPLARDWRMYLTRLYPIAIPAYTIDHRPSLNHACWFVVAVTSFGSVRRSGTFLGCELNDRTSTTAVTLLTTRMIAEWLQETANTRVEGLEWLQDPHFQDWTVTFKKEEERERIQWIRKNWRSVIGN